MHNLILAGQTVICEYHDELTCPWFLWQEKRSDVEDRPKPGKAYAGMQDGNMIAAAVG